MTVLPKITDSPIPAHYSKPLGFTLAELIVIVTVLGLLWTIGFISITGYFAGSRDSARVTDMNMIYTQLDVLRASSGTIPMPENYRTIALSGTNIAYQGYAGKSVLGSINLEKGWKDPKDNAFYTYTVNKKQSRAQLMGYFEEYDTTTLWNSSGSAIPLYRATAGVYKDRKVGVIGKNICTLLESTSLAPVQSTSTGIIDVATTSTGYTVYCDNNTATKWTGSVLGPMFVSNSVAYDSTPVVVNPTWTITWGGDCSWVSNTIGSNGDTSTCRDTRLYTHSWGTGLSFTGKTYNILKIPSDTFPSWVWWFNQNLAYPLANSTKYKGNNAWLMFDVWYYSCPGNNGTGSVDCTLVPTLGYLYQFSAAMSGATSNNNPNARTQGICPSWWWIPTSVDFTSVGNTYWPSATNNVVYTGSVVWWVPTYAWQRLPVNAGTFAVRWSVEHIWSSNTIYGELEYFSVAYPGMSMRTSSTNGMGTSVRCIRN